MTTEEKHYRLRLMELDRVSRYKTPLTFDQQLELKGELLSALIRISKLEIGLADITRLAQELMRENTILRQRIANKGSVKIRSLGAGRKGGRESEEIKMPPTG